MHLTTRGDLMFPDHLEVKVPGAPRLNVRLGEVGLKESASSGVGGGTEPLAPTPPVRTTLALAP
jgi:hypothetical protein